MIKRFSSHTFEFQIIIIYILLSLSSFDDLNGDDSMVSAFKSQSITPSPQTCKSPTGNCFCDEICVFKSDCCEDYKDFRQDTKPVDSSTIPKSDCVHSARTFSDVTDLEKHGSWFEAIAHCPLGTSNEIANRCNKSRDLVINFDDASLKHTSNISAKNKHFISLDLAFLTFRIRTEDIRLMAPVISKVNGRVYANLDCAICHDVLSSTVTGDEPMGSVLSQRLDLFNVFVHCRTFHDTDRLCVANSLLPRSWRRPCANKRFLKPQSTQEVFSLSEFKWHEFLVLPQNYIEFDGLNNEGLVKGSKTIRTIESVLDILQLLVCILSAFSLLVLLIVYGKTREFRRRVSNQLLMGLATSMLCLLLIYLTLPLLINQKDNSGSGSCLTVAVLLHYFFLATFAWMSTHGLSLINTFGGLHTCQVCLAYVKFKITRQSSDEDSLRKKYSDTMKSMVIRKNLRDQSISIHKRTIFSTIFAITLPLCFVIPALVLNQVYQPDSCQPEMNGDHYTHDKTYVSREQENNCSETSSLMSNFNPGFCLMKYRKRPWFTVHAAFILWFLVPTTSLLALNSTILLMVGMYIWLLDHNKTVEPLKDESVTSVDSKSTQLPNKSNRNVAKICLHLSITLGAVWIFQLLASLLPQQTILSRVAALVSSGQGAALGFISLTNSTKTRLFPNWSSIFISRRSNSRVNESKSVSSSSRVNTKVGSTSESTIA
ncbi:unnamed protein product [Schistosoma rodhaini]|nr:unnamed protein product [Schistosoma rodhaini]